MGDGEMGEGRGERGDGRWEMGDGRWEVMGRRDVPSSLYTRPKIVA